jgi:hypothetical protein
MVDGFQVASGHIRGEIPANSVLHRDDDATLLSTSVTTATIHVSADRISLDFRPPLRFVVHARRLGFLVEDVHWRSATLRFGGNVSVVAERVPAWLAFDLATQRVHDTLVTMITAMFAGSAFVRRGYDPFHDAQLEENVRALMARISAGGPSTATPPMPVLRGAGLSVTLTDAVVQRRDDAVLRLRPGTQARIDAQLRGDPTRGGLVGLVGARVSLNPPLEIESGDNTIALSGFHVRSESCGPTIRVQPEDLRFLRTSAGVATVGVLGGLFGLLVALREGGGRSPDAMVHGAATGLGVVDSLVARQLSEQFTAAAALALEQIRPRLKEAAPLVDWDALLCDSVGRPALVRPVSRH